MRQIGMFDGSQPLKITKPIRLIELFAGIGAQAKALERLGVEFEHYRVCEFDDYAVTSYNAIHGTNFESSDIREWRGKDLGVVDTHLLTYLLTYSFPCQDLSVAGRQEGMGEGSGTRSALLWEVGRLLTETEELPQILLMENVPQVVGAENKKNFFKWVNFLEGLGYKSKWAILNSRDFKIPQNRERCFMVSWLGDYYYDFPNPQRLEKVLRDLLQPESEIDEKYYISEQTLNWFFENSKKQKDKGNGFKFTPTDGNTIARCITTRAGSRMDDNYVKCEQVGTLVGGKWDKMHDITRRVYSTEGLSPTICTMSGGNLEPKIMTEPVLVGGFGEKKSNNGTQWYQQDRVYSADSVAMAHCASIPSGSYNYLVSDDIRVYDMYNAKEIDNKVVGTITAGVSHQGSGTFLVNDGKTPIRKLTQKECWRLMDFDDEDYENARRALNEKFYKGADRSGSQLYKQAGNSIVVNCLTQIIKEML